MLLSLTLALPGLALVGGCDRDGGPSPATAEPVADLSPDVEYLSALREAAGPEAVASLDRERESYEEWKRVRLAEIEAQPWYRARPEEADWSDDVWLGRDTWWHWTGGNEYTWRDLAQRAQRSGGSLDLLRLVDNRELPRAERFERFGLINDPSGSAPDAGEDGACAPDEHGLCLDTIDEPGVSDRTAALLGRPSGVMGLRLFDNPDFRPEAWDAENPYQPPAGCEPGERSEWSDRTPASNAAESRADCYQPPYLVGISCGFCHISFDPESPPADPAEPGWENLTGALGNVYLKEGPLFAWVLDFGDDAFYTDYLLAQPPGTSDTSRIATDDLDNPGAINALYRLDARVALAHGTGGAEELPNGGSEGVPRVLKDGADSVGLTLAALRVYVNIGMLGNRWLNDHDAYLLLAGAPRPQRPFAVEEAMTTPGYDGGMWWDATQVRVPDVVAYLSAGRSPRLSNAPSGAGRLADEATLARGRRLFADHCAACHAGERPTIDRRQDPEGWRDAMRVIVESPGFFDRDFLADDRRHPGPAVGVNLTRSMATNAVAGHVWEDFSSLDYKRLPAVSTTELPHPFDPGKSTEAPPARRRPGVLPDRLAGRPVGHRALLPQQLGRAPRPRPERRGAPRRLRGRRRAAPLAGAPDRAGWRAGALRQTHRRPRDLAAAAAHRGRRGGRDGPGARRLSDQDARKPAPPRLAGFHAAGPAQGAGAPRRERPRPQGADRKGGPGERAAARAAPGAAAEEERRAGFRREPGARTDRRQRSRATPTSGP